MVAMVTHFNESIISVINGHGQPTNSYVESHRLVAMASKCLLPLMRYDLPTYTQISRCLFQCHHNTTGHVYIYKWPWPLCHTLLHTIHLMFECCPVLWNCLHLLIFWFVLLAQFCDPFPSGAGINGGRKYMAMASFPPISMCTDGHSHISQLWCAFTFTAMVCIHVSSAMAIM